MKLAVNCSRKPAHTVAELASARQHQENRPTIMERAVGNKRDVWFVFAFCAHYGCVKNTRQSHHAITHTPGGGVGWGWVLISVEGHMDKTAGALAIELSSTGFVNSRIRALPHVHPRSPGSRPSFCRGFNEEFYLKKNRDKKVTGPARSNSQFKHSLN